MKKMIVVVSGEPGEEDLRVEYDLEDLECMQYRSGKTLKEVGIETVRGKKVKEKHMYVRVFKKEAYSDIYDTYDSHVEFE